MRKLIYINWRATCTKPPWASGACSFWYCIKRAKAVQFEVNVEFHNERQNNDEIKHSW